MPCVRQEGFYGIRQEPEKETECFEGKNCGAGGECMKDLLKTAQQHLADACKGVEDDCSIRYWAGYIKAIKDIDRKLKEEGIDPLEEE